MYNAFESDLLQDVQALFYIQTTTTQLNLPVCQIRQTTDDVQISAIEYQLELR